MSEIFPPCTFCGHDERKHHPTRTETWCIVGITDRAHCECPGYNPNSLVRVGRWLQNREAVAAANALAEGEAG